MCRLVGLLACVVMAACAPRPVPTRRPNVLLVVIDTLRADRLGAYGSTRGFTPFLDEFATAHHVVRQTRAQASWTNPSVASLLTSRWPSQHGIVDYRSALAESEQTLAETLRQAGYATGGFSANGLIGASLGFGQGFDRYQAHLLTQGTDPTYLRIPIRADAIGREALGWLDTLRAGPQRDAPVFVYLQLMEPHAPYAPPPDMLARVRGTRPPIDLARVSEAMFVGPLEPIDPEHLQEIVDAYDASVMAVDAALEAFFGALRERHFLDDAIVVITADHGEELQEHGLRGHGRTLYDEVLRVPLLVGVPGGTSRGTVEHGVSLIDIAPTVLELAAIPVPASFEGTSFARELDVSLGSRLRRLVYRVVTGGSESVTYSEHLRPPGEAPNPRTPHERAVVVEGAKLISWRGGEQEVYDLAFDPAEQTPNVVDEADRVRLEERLDAMRTRAERNRSTAEQRIPDARTREALQALGYLE
jgi:arylsulfatase A-like enzyme